MPYNSTDELPSAVKKLSPDKQRQFMHIVNSALKNGDSESEAFKKAWGVVNNKSNIMTKIQTDETIQEFGAYFTKASYDTKTGKMLFNATASDTSPDSYKEEMSLNLYKTFIDYINNGVNVPIYASLSHYPRLSGKGEIGVVTDIYIDGDKLKAKGYFKDTPLGVSVYNAIRKDRRDNIPPDDRVRISIGFYDRKHSHENGKIWEFKSQIPCLDCAKGVGGKTYLEGILEHLAVTRVPVNKRTDIVAKSEGKDMTTRYEDAVSIVGDPELVDEVEKAFQDEVTNKSGTNDGLIIKSEDSRKVWDDLSGLPNNRLLDLFKKMNEDGTITDDYLSNLINGILNQITPSSQATDIRKSETENVNMAEVNKGVAATEGASSVSVDTVINDVPETQDLYSPVNHNKLENGLPVNTPSLVQAAWAWYMSIRDGDEYTQQTNSEIESQILAAWKAVGGTGNIPYQTRALVNKGALPAIENKSNVDNVKPEIDKDVKVETKSEQTQSPAKVEEIKTEISNPAYKSIVTDFEAGLNNAVTKSGSERVNAFNELMKDVGQSLEMLHLSLVEKNPVEKSEADAMTVNRMIEEKLAPINAQLTQTGAQLAQILNVLNNQSVARANINNPLNIVQNGNVDVPTMKSIVMPMKVPDNKGKGMSISDIANATTFGK